MNPVPGILVFSLVETVILTLWVLLLGVGKDLSSGIQLTAAIVLFVGLVAEHAVAYNVGRGRPPFEFPRA